MTIAIRQAVVIGASSGIGEALAKRLAAAGAQVALVARREAELARVQREIAAQGKGSAKVYPHDVAEGATAAPLFNRIANELGGIDCVIYAAGVMPKLAESEYDFVKDRQMVQVNLEGAMAWFNPAAARFEAQRSGTLIGITSIAGIRGRRANPAYCTTKAAFDTYLESLRNRLSRHGVNVVTAKPGFVDTAMTRGLSGLLWLISADRAAELILRGAQRGGSREFFVPRRWSLVALVIRSLPSLIFRRLNI